MFGHVDAYPPVTLCACVVCAAYIIVCTGLAAVAAGRLAPGSTATLNTSKGPAATRAADVFVCDALQLSYRPCSCDAVLCIAVLHHMSSRQRRLALLQQLADVLRPGGRGLVTVWATAQEDPAKTIQRWHKIQDGQVTAPPAAAQQEGQQEEGPGSSAQQQPQQQHAEPVCAGAAAAGPSQQQQQQPPGDGNGAAGVVVEGPDYFVPWHLPFHKAGTLAANGQHKDHHQQQGTNGSTTPTSTSSSGLSSSSGTTAAVRSSRSLGPAAAVDVRVPTVNAAKGAVVLQRYYHLFEQGELEALTAQVPGLRVVQVFYDRSNWCVEFEKQQAA